MPLCPREPGRHAGGPCAGRRAEIQVDLKLDCHRNLERYPLYQGYFRTHRPRRLAVWGCKGGTTAGSSMLSAQRRPRLLRARSSKTAAMMIEPIALPCQ